MLIREGFLNEPEQRHDWFATVLSRYATFVECNLYLYIFLVFLFIHLAIPPRARSSTFVPCEINWQTTDSSRSSMNFDWKWFEKGLDDRTEWFLDIARLPCPLRFNGMALVMRHSSLPRRLGAFCERTRSNNVYGLTIGLSTADRFHFQCNTPVHLIL